MLKQILSSANVKFFVAELITSGFLGGLSTGRSSVLNPTNVSFMLRLRERELAMRQTEAEVAMLNALGSSSK